LAESGVELGRKQRRPRIYYGWWIVAVCFVVLMFHAGAAFYAFGRFMPTLIEELNTSTAAVSAAISVYLLILGLTGPVAGKLTDRFGARPVLVGGGVIAGVGLMLLSLTSALWHLYLLYFVVGLGMSGAGNVAVGVAISNWFSKRRGLAMGITMAGISVGAIALAPLAHYLIETVGWQNAFLILGALTIVLIVPTVMLVVRTRPEEKGLMVDGMVPGQGGGGAEDSDLQAGVSAPVEAGWSAGSVLKTVSFWLVLTAFFFSSVGVAGVLQHEVRILEAMGVPLGAAAVALGLTGLIGGGGKIGFGFVADKLSPRYTAMACFALQLAGVVILMFTRSTAMVWVFVIVFGFAMGGNITVQPLVTGHLFGTASFGVLFGWVLAAGAVGAAVGPILMGAIYDAAGSYSLGLIILTVAYSVGVVALLLVRKPKQASEAG